MAANTFKTGLPMAAIMAFFGIIAAIFSTRPPTAMRVHRLLAMAA